MGSGSRNETVLSQTIMNIFDKTTYNLYFRSFSKFIQEVDSIFVTCIAGLESILDAYANSLILQN